MAIPALVMVADGVLNEATELGNDTDKLGTPGGVRLHQRCFFRRKSAFLSKQWRELLVNLSYVVKQGGRLNLFNFPSRKPELNRNCPRHLTDAK